MDKGLKKIEELKNELEKQFDSLFKLEKEKTKKLEEKTDLKKESLHFLNLKNEIISTKDEYTVIKYNLPKAKRRTIIITTLLLLISALIISFGVVGLVTASAIEFSKYFLISLIGFCSIPAFICFGEQGNYYSNKKYIKNFNEKKYENKLERFNIVINSCMNKMKSIDAEIKELDIKIDDIKVLIQNIKNEISQITSTREAIINEYVTNNTELDNALNEDLSKSKKIKTKKLIKNES